MIAKGAAYLRAFSMPYKLELAGPESQNTERLTDTNNFCCTIQKLTIRGISLKGL